MADRTVRTIPAVKNRFTSESIDAVKKRRVAAYARVSTDQEEQLTSYEAQIDYYTEYIKNHEGWEFIMVYTDAGISGTSVSRREGFKQMVKDGLSGKFDLLITKSVSRFARNTVDSLTTIRQFKEKGVECFFEKENIWTFDSKGEFLITLMSSLAQEESRSISENVTWGKRKSLADGKITMSFSSFLGYDRGPDGQPVINEEQAEIVRDIYSLYLKGLTDTAIAKHLTESEIPTPMGKKKWSSSVVRSILTNEKYIGNALLQKTYTVSYLSKKQKKNEGELPQYYVENSHPAIISPEVFDLAQAERRHRRESGQRYSGVSIFSSKIKCGQCGSWYGSKVWHSNDKYRRVVYQCNHKYGSGAKCTTPHLTEDEIKAVFIKAVNELLSEKKELLDNIVIIRKTLCSTKTLEHEQSTLYDEMSMLAELTEKCVVENSRQPLNQQEYQRKYNSLVERYETAKARYEEVNKQIELRKAREKVLSAFAAAVKNHTGVIAEFDEALWGTLVDHIVVHGRGDVRVVFRDGSEVG